MMNGIAPGIRRTSSVLETEAVARELASALGAGDWVGLIGPLGAGKSVFARAVGRALGVSQPMPSPTYTLLNCHTGSLPVYHMDLYRIASADELDFAGLTPYFQGAGVCLVEWADRIPVYWPPNGWIVRIRFGGDEQREISITRHGDSG